MTARAVHNRSEENEVFYYICYPFAALLRLFYDLTNSYGISLILFTLVVKLVLLPFQMKSKKSMVRMNRMNGQIQEIQKKYANNPQKQQEELQKFYAEQGVNPMGGCLWSFLPLPIMIALYNIIREPIVYFMNFGSKAAGQEVLAKAKDAIAAAGIALSENNVAFEQIEVMNVINQKLPDFAAGIENWFTVDYNFIGINLETIPTAAFQMLKSGISWAVIGLILIPVVSAALSFLQSKIAMMGQKGSNGAANSMMYMMPLMSLWIGFTLPAALGVYWIANSVFSIIQEFILGKFYNTKLEAEEDERQRKLEEDRRKRQEEGRKKQEKIAQQTEKKLTLKEKQQAAQEAKEAKAAKKKTSTTEAGRVGDRPYARGRSYVADRYDEK